MSPQSSAINLNFQPSIGQVVRAWRTAKKLTLEELAARSGLSKGYLSELENGRIANLKKAANIHKIAQGLDIPVTDLITKRFPDETSKLHAAVEKLERTERSLQDSQGLKELIEKGFSPSRPPGADIDASTERTHRWQNTASEAEFQEPIERLLGELAIRYELNVPPDEIHREAANIADGLVVIVSEAIEHLFRKSSHKEIRKSSHKER